MALLLNVCVVAYVPPVDSLLPPYNGPSMDPLWTPYGPPMNTLWTPYGALWSPYGPPMNTLGTPYGAPMVRVCSRGSIRGGPWGSTGES